MEPELGRFSFQHDSESGAALKEWWVHLHERRGPRADVRRGRGIGDILLSPEFYHALRVTGAAGKVTPARFALVVGLLSHVETDNPEQPFAMRLALSEDRSRALVSGLRFRRLLAIEDTNQLYLHMVRILRLAGREANILDLAQSVYWWNEVVRKTWARHYYENAPDQE